MSENKKVSKFLKNMRWYQGYALHQLHAIHPLLYLHASQFNPEGAPLDSPYPTDTPPIPGYKPVRSDESKRK